MDGDKNFRDLLAAIRGNAASRATPCPSDRSLPLAPSSLPLPLPTSLPPSSPPCPPGHPSPGAASAIPAANYAATFASNYAHLSALLRPHPTAPASFSQTISSSPGVAGPAAPSMPVSERQSDSVRSRTRAEGLGARPLPAAQQGLQHTPAASAVATSADAADAADAMRNEKGMLAWSAAGTSGASPPTEITTQLAAIMRERAASAVEQAPALPPADTFAVVGEGPQPPGKARKRPNPPPPEISHEVPQQQFAGAQTFARIFYRYADGLLSRTLQGTPAWPAAEKTLKDRAAALRLQLTRGHITQNDFIVSVATCVQHLCPRLDRAAVMQSFEVWYQKKYDERQRPTRQTSIPDVHEQAKQQRAQQAQMQRIATYMQNKVRNAHSANAAMPLGMPRAVRGEGRLAGLANAINTMRPLELKSSPMFSELPSASVTQNPREGGPVVHSNRERGHDAIAKPESSRGGLSATAKKVMATNLFASEEMWRKCGAENTLSHPHAGIANQLTKESKVSRKPLSSTTHSSTPLELSSKADEPVEDIGASSKDQLRAENRRQPKQIVPENATENPLHLVTAKPYVKATSKRARAKISGGPGEMSATKRHCKAKKAMITESLVAINARRGLSEKRALNSDETSTTGPTRKKRKTTAKPAKRDATHKKNKAGLSASPTKNISKTTSAEKDPSNHSSRKSSMRPPHDSSTRRSTETEKAAFTGIRILPNDQVQQKQQRNGELSALPDILDIEFEQNALGRDATAQASELSEDDRNEFNRFLSGPILRQKLQAAATRHGLDGNMTKDVTELLSHGTRERVGDILQSLQKIKAVRTEKNRIQWKIKPVGSDLGQVLEGMRTDEERMLVTASQMRMQRSREHDDRKAKRVADEAAQKELKTKNPSLAADAKGKELHQRNITKRELSSQSEALSNLLKNRRKRAAVSPQSALLVPRDDITSATRLKRKRATLPLIVSLAPQTTENVDSLVWHGGDYGRNKRLQDKAQAGGIARPESPLTLRDCLFLMESDQNCRKSSQLYKWMARLDSPNTGK